VINNGNFTSKFPIPEEIIWEMCYTAYHLKELAANLAHFGREHIYIYIYIYTYIIWIQFWAPPRGLPPYRGGEVCVSRYDPESYAGGS
jgi:hypothetical protein